MLIISSQIGDPRSLFEVRARVGALAPTERLVYINRQITVPGFGALGHKAPLPRAVLGWISGQSAECSALPVESSFRLAFLAEFEPRSGQLGPLFGAVPPSKIMLPPRREHDIRFFV